MPLYMDIHTVDADDFSVEDVVKAHMEDLAIQDRYDVTQLKYWVNEDAKTLFCLMKGPDKDACHKVHKESHGNTACNIIEVSDNEYNLFMGIGTDVNDLAKTHKGDLDTGYRSILLLNLFCFSSNPGQYMDLIYQLIEDFNGVIIVEPSNELTVSFIYASQAILCANAIKKQLMSSKDKVEFSMAISSGRPVDEEGDQLFEETKKNVHSLCSMGLSGMIYVDEDTIALSEKELSTQKSVESNLKCILSEDLHLALSISEAFKNLLNQSGFKSEDLYAELGLSKSQAYRKIKSLVSLAPNQLIQEISRYQ